MLFQSRPAKMGILKGCKLGLLPLALCELHLCYRSFQLFGEINWNYLAVFNFSLQPAEYATILVIFFFKMLWNVSFSIFLELLSFCFFSSNYQPELFRPTDICKLLLTLNQGWVMSRLVQRIAVTTAINMCAVGEVRLIKPPPIQHIWYSSNWNGPAQWFCD